MPAVCHTGQTVLSALCVRHGDALGDQGASQTGERPVRVSEEEVVKAGESVSIIPTFKLQKNQKYIEESWILSPPTKRTHHFPIDIKKQFH